MRLTFNLQFILFVAVAVAKGGSSGDDHQWIAPRASDLRSPCPGLNTLANHGYLPRDGRNISIPMMLDAAIEGFNLGADAIIQAAKFGLLAGNAPTTLDLDTLDLHNLIEHDASISRGDLAVTGDNLHFNETIFSTLANANPGNDSYDAESVAGVMNTRLAISLATNPDITNTPKEFNVRLREASFFLSIMGNVSTGVAPKNFVQIFFREERLPIAEGWKRSEVTITAENLNPIEDELDFFSNWTQTQACENLVLGPALTI